jgi:hypothetical protein
VLKALKISFDNWIILSLNSSLAVVADDFKHRFLIVTCLFAEQYSTYFRIQSIVESYRNNHQLLLFLRFLSSGLLFYIVGGR